MKVNYLHYMQDIYILALIPIYFKTYLSNLRFLLHTAICPPRKQEHGKYGPRPCIDLRKKSISVTKMDEI